MRCNFRPEYSRTWGAQSPERTTVMKLSSPLVPSCLCMLYCMGAIVRRVGELTEAALTVICAGGKKNSWRVRI